MRKHVRIGSPRTRAAVVAALAAAVVAGGAGIAAKATGDAAAKPALAHPPVSLAAAKTEAATKPEVAQRTAVAKKAALQEAHAAKKAAKKAAAKKADPKLPSGRATATSFWDPETASGKPMRYQTIASPYWPLGTKVKVTYGGKARIGYVEDFGPAEWAVAQHDIPAILDLSEEMMADLTGVPSNSVHVTFEILQWGSGRVYRHSGTGYSLAMGK
ncbi:hypothetical protein J5X84_06470 [Streptosporangiaceae bacterium NEAU-GS5]|nr:hypothetical protein [Streptosporangiaceae bacterium NEAU-GS5]